MGYFNDRFCWDILMAGNAWKFVNNMSRSFIQLLNCTTWLSNYLIVFGTDCLGLVCLHFYALHNSQKMATFLILRHLPHLQDFPYIFFLKQNLKPDNAFFPWPYFSEGPVSLPCSSLVARSIWGWGYLANIASIPLLQFNFVKSWMRRK